jgi:tRNA-splicing ligase RtcB (3'-phosphate/5'-hydroxy nucleic acid ligase)
LRVSSLRLCDFAGTVLLFSSDLVSTNEVPAKSQSRKEETRKEETPQGIKLAQTAGVECRKDSGVVDEIPGAYKDIDEVMRAQEDLVEIVAELKQVICVKG